MDKISAIYEAIEEYFSLNKSVDIIPAKDLMPLFIKKGIFTKDYKKGLPIRKILRDLDKKNKLSFIPYAYAESKTTNVNWYFVRNHETFLVKPGLKPKAIDNQSTRDEDYVLDLCDKALKLKASRQNKFPFLLGDPDINGNRKQLPVDAYYDTLNLVIEYKERQHTEPIKHFDKPDVMTVSGVDRGEQRKIYDQRRREVLPENGIKLIELSYSDFEYDSRKKIIRDEVKDLNTILQIFKREGIEI